MVTVNFYKQDILFLTKATSLLFQTYGRTMWLKRLSLMNTIPLNEKPVLELATGSLSRGNAYSGH